MPFQSKAQERYLFAKHPDVAEKFLHDSGQPKNLPEKIKKPTSPWLKMKKG